MNRILIAALAICAGALLSFGAAAGDLPKPRGAACLDPIAPGDPTISIRDGRVTLTADRKTATIAFCVVSKEARPIVLYEAVVGIFRQNGSFILAGSNTFRNVQPLTDGPSGKPALILMFDTQPGVRPEDTKQLLDTILVQARWCYEPTEAACTPDKFVSAWDRISARKQIDCRYGAGWHTSTPGWKPSQDARGIVRNIAAQAER